MPGQLSNFMKNFGNLIYTEAQPFFKVGKILKDGLSLGGEVFWNLNMLDDPKINNVEKASAIFNTVTAPLSLVPVVGTMTEIVGAAAPYVKDVIEGRKDAPPVGADIHSK
jgi:Tfp pilus assembly protein PilZ